MRLISTFIKRLSIFVLVLTAGCSQDKTSTNPICSSNMPVAIDNAITTALAAHPDTAGVVVALYHPTYGYIHKAYGLENRTSATPMAVDHIFDIGSVMKNFRWLIMHKFAAAGSLNLNDAVNTHVASPVLPGRTIKHLMQHSSGMIDINESTYMPHVMANLTHSYTYAEMMGFLTGSSSAGDFTNGLTDVFTPGTDFRYSSFGPLVASEITQTVTGSGMRSLIKDMIIGPLNLGQTSFIHYDPKPAKVAQGYDDATTEMNDMDDYADTLGFSSGFGGLMYSSGCDLAQYTNNEFNNNDFLPASIVSSMMTEKIINGGIEIGLGVFKYPAWGNFWGHLGSSIHGHSSAIAHRTSDKLSIVVLANIDESHDNYATHFAVISAIGNAL